MQKLSEFISVNKMEIFGNYIDNFEKYMQMMLDYNEKVNLTAITERDEIIEKHFMDCVSLLMSEKLFENCSMIDIGTGAGFPSIPVKIVRPDIDITMLDALNKRITFLNSVIDELKLPKIKAVHMRAEDAGKIKEMREKYDISVARAVADMAVLSEYALPFVKKDGYFVAMKGSAPDEELENAKGAIKQLGGKTEEVKKVILPSGIEHSLIIVRKVSETPARFPRKAGKPVKEPLR